MKIAYLNTYTVVHRNGRQEEITSSDLTATIIASALTSSVYTAVSEGDN